MKGKQKVIDVLNEVLAGERVAISQYLMHAEMLRSWGFTALADQLRKESVDEAKHAERLTNRILYLEGVPELGMTEAPQIGQTVTEQLQNDLGLEHRAVKRLNEGIAVARKEGDNTSADMLLRILVDEEEHVSWLQTQLGLIEKLGENPYLVSQLRA